MCVLVCVCVCVCVCVHVYVCVCVCVCVSMVGGTVHVSQAAYPGQWGTADCDFLRTPPATLVSFFRPLSFFLCLPFIVLCLLCVSRTLTCPFTCIFHSPLQPVRMRLSVRWLNGHTRTNRANPVTLRAQARE